MQEKSNDKVINNGH